MIYKTNSGYGVNFNQIVENGDFVDSTKWSGKNATISVSNGVCTFTANAQWGGLRHSLMPITAGHIYIIKCDLKATTAGSNMFINLEGSVNLSLSSGYIPLTTDWQTYTYKSVAFSTGGNFYLVFGDKRSADRDAFQVKNVYLTDITQDFGAGNESATVADFREMYPDDYYDYTLSDWQWAKKGKITSYITPVIENGTTLLPIENHIVGLAKNGIGRIEIEGNSYQNGTPTPTSPIPIQSFNGSGDTVKLVGASGKELQLPNSITLNNQTISLELNKVGTYADKLIIDKASGKVELVRNTGKQNLGLLTWYKGYEVSGSKTYYSFLFYALMSNSSPNLPNTKYPVVAYANRGQDKSLSCEVASNVCIITDSDYDNTTALQTSLNNVFVYYALKSNYPTTTDITDATYQINGITYNVSDWLNFVDREIEIETDGLAQSNLSVDYEPTLIYNYAKRELPAGFVRLDYIESTGTQYIDTGVISSTKVKTIFDFEFSAFNDAFNRVFGTTSVGNSQYGCRTLSAGQSQLLAERPDGDSRYTSWSAALNTRYNLAITDAFYVNGTKIGNDYGSTEIVGRQNIWFFAQNPNTSRSSIKLFSAKLYDNETLARNFIPCYRYSDGIEGLYDTVGKQFYTNQGTGRFLRGKEIDSGNLLELKNFVRGYPSNTAFENTTKRTFTENTYVVGLTSNNYYSPSAVSAFNIQKETNSISLTSRGGYGIGLVVRLKKNTRYKIYGIASSGYAGYKKVLYYSSDGTYLSNSDFLVDGEFTTSNIDFTYSLLTLGVSLSSDTDIAYSNISLHEVYN